MLGGIIPLVLLADSLTPFDVITKVQYAMECCVVIDITVAKNRDTIRASVISVDW